MSIIAITTFNHLIVHMLYNWVIIQNKGFYCMIKPTVMNKAIWRVALGVGDQRRNVVNSPECLDPIYIFAKISERGYSLPFKRE